MPRPDVSEERRNQILEAAARVFARAGFHEARMEDIRQEVGLSKGILYWYFKSKDDLITALLQQLFERDLSSLEALLRQEGTVSERLLLYIDYSAADLEQAADLLPISYEFYALATRQASVRDFLKEYFDKYRQVLAALVQQGVERGEFRPVNAHHIASILVAVSEGLLELAVLDPQAVNWKELSQTSLRLLTQGMKA